MRSSLVFTIIGDDRPGLVEQIARTVNEHDANWLGSRMSQLGGKFAGMIHVEGGEEQLCRLKVALEALAGLTIVVEEGLDTAPSDNRMVVTMLGLDRPGIVREVSRALAARQLNVLELETRVTRAAMTGGGMFHGTATVAGRASEDLAQLETELDRLSRELGVDIELQEE